MTEIILAALATYRLAILLVEEEGPFRIFATLRERIVGKAVITRREPWKSLSGLVTCQLCAGVWLAVLCAILVTIDGQVGNLLLLIFGLAGTQAFLARRDG